LGSLDDPAGPADLQRLGRRPTKDRGQQRHRRPQPRRQALLLATGEVVGITAGVVVALAAEMVVAAGVAVAAGIEGAGAGVGGIEGAGAGVGGSAGPGGRAGLAGVVGVVGGVAGDQDPGQGAVTGQPPTRLRIQRPGQPASPPTAPAWPRRLASSTVTVS
jgi:hypothetical protein